ncbi:hypothetical protein PVAG01_08771 [Phlyctema vagabunda]|uniref:Uncharacterized protein n=1 Tax=Phlyctema vagabunda TaxID=108571 RepID=A0ABR4PAD1_9HELO
MKLTSVLLALSALTISTAADIEPRAPPASGTTSATATETPALGLIASSLNNPGKNVDLKLPGVDVCVGDHCHELEHNKGSEHGKDSKNHETKHQESTSNKPTSTSTSTTTSTSTSTASHSKETYDEHKHGKICPDPENFPRPLCCREWVHRALHLDCYQGSRKSHTRKEFQKVCHDDRRSPLCCKVPLPGGGFQCQGV